MVSDALEELELEELDDSESEESDVDWESDGVEDPEGGTGDSEGPVDALWVPDPVALGAFEKYGTLSESATSVGAASSGAPMFKLEGTFAEGTATLGAPIELELSEDTDPDELE